MSTSTLLAAVVVLVILVVAAVVLYRRSASAPAPDGFMPGDPAVPMVRETTETVGHALSQITRSAGALEATVAQIDRQFGIVDMGPALNESRLQLGAVVAAMRPVVKSAASYSRAVRISPATYASSLGLYQGLREADKQLLATADAFGQVATEVLLRIESTEGHDHSAQYGNAALSASLQSAALQTRQIANGIRSLVRSVHRLGSSLLLE